MNTWTTLGLSFTGTAKLPSKWKEIQISAYTFMEGSSTEQGVYQGRILADQTNTFSSNRICLGGYTYSSNDYGSCWANVSYTEVSIRHYIYNGKSTTPYFAIRYR